MNEILYTKTYEQYKMELDTELTKAAESFVKVGYLLKVARDTNILAESGYSTVTEFAQAEYGLDKTQVSRFIHINDKFAENGYSDQLQDHYRGFGYAKLTLMLQLPDAINEELTPKYSKTEIQSIKDEVDEESKISDLEVLMEPKEQKETSLIGQIIEIIGRDNPELYKSMWLESGEYTVEHMKEKLCPDGEKTYSVRIAGTGRLMVMMKETEDYVAIINVRNGEEEKVSWEDLREEVSNLYPEDFDAAAGYEAKYGIELPKEEKKEPEPVKRKEEKVVKAKEPPKKEPKKAEEEKKEEVAPVQQTLPGVEISHNEENQAKTEIEEPENDQLTAVLEDEQIEGQAEITDYPEFMPDKNAPILIKLSKIENLIKEKNYLSALIEIEEVKYMVKKLSTPEYEVPDEQ